MLAGLEARTTNKTIIRTLQTFIIGYLCMKVGLRWYGKIIKKEPLRRSTQI